MPNTPHTANTPLTKAQRESVSTALDSIRSSLSFLVGLRPSDKQRLLKMGHKNRAFVEDAIKAGVNNPSMLPRSMGAGQESHGFSQSVYFFGLCIV
jgi:hypothetical protein